MTSPRLRSTVIALAALGLLVGCAFGPPPSGENGSPPRFPTPSASPSPSDDGGDAAAVTPLAKHLSVPWGLAFLPDGSALVTERDTRRILRVGPDSTSDGLMVRPVQTISDAQPGGEGGLLGIAVSPAYASDKTIFIYYTTAVDNRIARLTLGGPPTPIVTGIPRAVRHNGGRLAFGPDGYLYASTGDALNKAVAQSRTSLGGKILRMTTAGKPAPGNPFPGSLVYSYGHSDVEGFAWDAQQRLYATESGGTASDEVNLIRPGGNYGWPAVEGTGTNPKYINPIVAWPSAVASCAGDAVSESTLVVACLRGARMYLVGLNGRGGILGQPQDILTNAYGRLRTVVAAPDGTLWLTTSNRDGQGQPKDDDDQILRLVLTGGGGAGKS